MEATRMGIDIAKARDLKGNNQWPS
jgi:hypothetical protein